MLQRGELQVVPGRRKKTLTTDLLNTRLSAKIVGQPAAVNAIIPYVHMYQAGLSPEGRPLGVFLLLGPTGTGKTRTVEALAEVLHGSAKNLLRIDCGEYQMDHDVAKLIGAPPGYLGHRETQPLLTQASLTAVTTETCGASIVLFDEIEKAAPTMTKMLLGILDKAALRLGDNTTVNFERSLIFLTSNLGARHMMKELGPAFGFQGDSATPAGIEARLSRVAETAAKRRFSPEFMNRVDAVVTYQPLAENSLRAILDLQIHELQMHIEQRLASRAFRLYVPEQSRKLLLTKGTSTEYGAREIRRTLHMHITRPLASLIAEGRVPPGSSVQVLPKGDRLQLKLVA
jgi:ATP-dependent Clp protease ATP-binding subunit ClpA